jgi:hypothetical protein
MDLQTLKNLNPEFDPKSFTGMPHPNTQLFDSSKFPGEDFHKEAEQAGREFIRAELSRKAGGKPVYSQSELIYSKGSVKGAEIFNAISSGQAVVR